MRKIILTLFLSLIAINNGYAASLPLPTTDEHGGASTDRFAVFAGGCFWGIEAVFEHVKGVKKSVSGYAGGTAKTANYDAVSTGKTGHGRTAADGQASSAHSGHHARITVHTADGRPQPGNVENGKNGHH